MTSRAEGISIQPGTKKFESLRVAMMTDGSDLAIPVHIVGGARPGPKLCLTAFTHGDDATFVTDAFKDVVEKTNVEGLSGSLIALPVCNPNAYEADIRWTPVDIVAHGDVPCDMNRVFPGNPNGNLSQKMAWAISENIIKNVDYIIDFHTGMGPHLNYRKMIVVPGMKTSDRVQELSEIFGLDIILRTIDSGRLGGSLSGYASTLGIPAVVPEFGGGELYNVKENIETATRGIQNTLKHLGMIEGKPILPKKLLFIERKDTTYLRVSHGGLFRPESGTDGMELVGTVVKGRKKMLARVISPYTFQELERIETPYQENLVITSRVRSRVLPGETAYQFANMAKVRWIRQ